MADCCFRGALLCNKYSERILLLHARSDGGPLEFVELVCSALSQATVPQAYDMLGCYMPKDELAFGFLDPSL